MVGYLDNKNRVLNEWYQLFKQKNNTHSSTTQKYWERIQAIGFPDPKEDNWRYSSLEEFLEHNFVFSKKNSLNISQYKKLRFSIDAYHLTFINGQFSPELSDKHIEPWILNINHDPNRHKTNNPIQPEIFLYLTEYLSDATVNINLPKKNITKKPLYLLHISEGSNVNNQLITSYYHHHLQIEHDSNTCVIEHFVSMNKNSHFSSARMSIKTEDHSKLHHIKLICENRRSYHIAHNDINIGQYSDVNSNVFIILGPKLTRHQTSIKLNHTGSSLSLNSLTFLSEKDIGNIHTYLEHNNQGYALSRQLHKIIACNCSIGSFNGLIKVNPNSKKTDGKMINRNLLLHRDAIINSMPKLEIYSEDVKCSHGATVGEIDTEHLFYLSTRGIPRKDAVKMLIHAFAVEITRSLENNFLQDRVLKKINQALTGITI